MYKRNVIHVIANCRDCEWDCQFREDAQEQAKAHAIQFKHLVSVEVGIGITYDYRKPKLQKRSRTN